MTERRLTISQVARTLGVGRTYLAAEIAAGRLRAERLSGPKNRNHWRISPQDIAEWGLKAGVDLRLIRQSLRQPGVLALVGVPAPYWTILSSELDVRSAPGLFQLGRLVETERVWGVLVDLDHVYPSDCVRAFSGYAKRLERPELIGLLGEGHGESEANRLSEVFDLLLDRHQNPERLRAAVRRLCPGRAGRG